MRDCEYDLIVLAPFPTEKNIKDGMMLRVDMIDKLISDQKRLYVEISFKKYLFENDNPIKLNDNLFVLHLNILNVLKICKLILNSKKIYIHSLYNVLKAFPWILFTKAEIFFDLHGIVPEEELYKKKYTKYLILNTIEKFFFKRNKKNKKFNIIYVTESMKNYMRSKYKIVANDFIVPIFPEHLYNIETNERKISEIRSKYKIKDDDVIFIYSGNTQKWQKIELMLKYITNLSVNSKYKFFILSGEYQKFKQLLSKYGLVSKENIFLGSVSPQDISSYYSLAHYGFLLRDKHILNNVACPTKAIEYLTFGIVPIIWEENIGDFKQLGYEYISVKELGKLSLKSKKSVKNIKIAQYIKKRTIIESERLKNKIKYKM